MKFEFPSMSPLKTVLPIALLLLGLLNVSGQLSESMAPKTLILPLALTFLLVTHLPKSLTSGWLLLALPFLYALARITSHFNQPHALLIEFISLLAAFLGFSRAFPLLPRILIPLSLLLTLRGLWDYLLASNLGRGVDATMVSFFVHKNRFGMVLLAFIAYHVWVAFASREGKAWMRLNWVALALALVCLILSDSRSAQLGFLVAMMVFLALKFRIQGIWPSRARWAVWGGIALALVVLTLSISDRQLLRVVQGFTGPVKGPGFREWAWTAGWRLFQENPVLGAGVGNYVFFSKQHEPVWPWPTNPFINTEHAHNHYLQLLAERGVLGFSLEFALLLLALAGFWRASGRGRDASATLAMLGLLGIAVQSIFTVANEYPVPRLLYWGLIGFGLSHWTWANRKIGSGLIARVVLGALLLIGGIMLYRYTRFLAADFYYVQYMTRADLPLQQRLQKLERSLAIMRHHPEASYAVASLHLDNGYPRKSLEEIELLEQHAPHLKPTGILQAQAYQALHMQDSALNAAQEVLSKYPYETGSMKVAIESAARTGQCNLVDSLQRFVKAHYTFYYRMPGKLNDSTFEISFQETKHYTWYQKALGGDKVKSNYRSLVLKSHQRAIRNATRTQEIQRINCPAKPD